MPMGRWKGGAVLLALPTEGRCMTAAQVASATGLSNDYVFDLAVILERQGLIKRARPGCYRRTEAGDIALASGAPLAGQRSGVTPQRRADTLKDRVWKALRMLRKATLAEIVEITGPGASEKPDALAMRYLGRLTTAGVTGVTKKRVAGALPGDRSLRQYVLLHDLGPLAPVWQRGPSHLLDRNKARPVADVIGGVNG